MPHVDDGTVHAYLDGELPREEMERVRAHIEECAVCRGRLEEERALVERASRLLQRAAPPVTGRPVPEFEHLTPRSRPRLPFVPLAWAATLALAIGAGWYLRGLQAPRAEAVAPPILAAAPPAAPTTVATRDDQVRRSPPSHPGGGGSTGVELAAVSARAAARAQGVNAAPPPSPTIANSVTPRDEVASKVAAADRAVRPAEAQSNVYIDGAPMPPKWDDISVDSARVLLGGVLASIPGVPIDRVLASRTPQTLVLITQTVAANTAIELHERRAEDNQAALTVTPQREMQRSTTQRLARYVGALRVEISGPVSADSLSRLLDLVR